MLFTDIKKYISATLFLIHVFHDNFKIDYKNINFLKINLKPILDIKYIHCNMQNQLPKNNSGTVSINLILQSNINEHIKYFRNMYVKI